MAVRLARSLAATKHAKQPRKAVSSPLRESEEFWGWGQSMNACGRPPLQLLTGGEERGRDSGMIEKDWAERLYPGAIRILRKISEGRQRWHDDPFDVIYLTGEGCIEVDREKEKLSVTEKGQDALAYYEKKP